jgi:hypothetical protein
MRHMVRRRFDDEFRGMSMPEGSMRETDDRMKYPGFLLTYAASQLVVDTVYRFLLKKRFMITEVVKEWHKKTVLVNGVETKVDDVGGRYHFHAFMQAGGERRRRLSADACIVGGERPNIKGVGKKLLMDKRYYIRKGYVECRGLMSLHEPEKGLQRLLHQDDFQRALDIWPGVDTRGYIYNRVNGEIGLRCHYERRNRVEDTYTATFTKESFIIPEVITEWVNGNVLAEVHRPKSLILWGESRMGKTQFARSIGAHWYIQADWMVAQIKENVKYGIIDDVRMDKFMYWKQFLGCQPEPFVVTDKYRQKDQIRFGKPVIWICNESPSEWKGVDYDWLQRNCLIVNIAEAMYRVHP